MEQIKADSNKNCRNHLIAWETTVLSRREPVKKSYGLLMFFMLILPAFAWGFTVDEPFGTDLIAGKRTVAGEVLIWNDAEYLYVKYATLGEWCLLETHLHVASTFTAIPQTKTGNPIPGRFKYKGILDPCGTELSYKIPLEWDFGTNLFIAANATVRKGLGEEGAWAAGSDFPGKNWATYTNYIVQCAGGIGDLVWQDLNRNGIQDYEEPGIAGVAVSLKDAAENLLATTSTDAKGSYQFAELCAGNYTVEIDHGTLPDGLIPTLSGVGLDRAVDSDGSPVVMLQTDASMDQTIDFGYMVGCLGQIGDLIWEDRNRNGLQDWWEPGMDGVTVKLYDSNKTLIAMAASGKGPASNSGYYQFTGLCAGSYWVEALKPSPTISSAYYCNPDQEIPGDSNCSPAGVDLPTDNSSNQTIDFGFIKPGPR